MSKKTKAPDGAKIVKELFFDLTEAEYAEKAKGAAALADEVLQLEKKFDTLKDEWKAKINERQAKVDEILKVIHAKKEKRTVDAVFVKNHDNKEIEYWTQDSTGEWFVAERRTMTLDEMQGELPLEKKTSKKSKKEEAFAKNDPVAEAHAAGGKDPDVADAIREETSKRTKLSAVDGPRA